MCIWFVDKACIQCTTGSHFLKKLGVLSVLVRFAVLRLVSLSYLGEISVIDQFNEKRRPVIVILFGYNENGLCYVDERDFFVK